MAFRSSQDFARIALPDPPDVYQLPYMRSLVRRAEELISSRIAKDELATLGSMGIPFIKAHGSNAALAITAGAGITQLTFNTLDADTDPDTALQTGASNLKASYASSYMLGVSIKHNAAPTVGFGTDNKYALIYLYVNAAEVQRLAQILVTGARTDAIFFLTLAANDVADVRLNSALLSFTVDMTGSYLWALRLSQSARSRVI